MTARRVAVAREVHPGERRVAATPHTVLRLRELGYEVLVERGVGEGADFADAAYAEAGASIVEDTAELWAAADVMLKVRAPAPHPTLGLHEADLLRPGARLIAFIWPAQNGELVTRLARGGVTTLAMDCVPRISRAQSMDALSSMANIAGYRAVVEAAYLLPRFLGGQITAAGRIDPARVLVIGAGVAGLAAIGAAKALGAIVRAFDTRPAVREQVQSLGAEFLELRGVAADATGAGGYSKEVSDAYLKAEHALFAAQAMEVDAIITTALVPGRPAPVLITAGMVEAMREGSVIVDLAAEQGGNCALTVPGERVVRHGVSIVGYTDLPSRMASQASQLYGMNVAALLALVGQGDSPDLDDAIVRGALVTHAGEVTWPPPPPPEAAPAAPPPPEPAGSGPDRPIATARAAHAERATTGSGWLLVAGLALVAVGVLAPAGLMAHLTVFVLACIVGWQVVWNVTPALHTPLMSVTNAISGIIIIGGMLQVSGAPLAATTILGALAIFLATINIVGGFLVTRRMLAMFRR